MTDTVSGLTIEYSDSLWSAAQGLFAAGPQNSSVQISGLNSELMNFPGVLARLNSRIQGVAGCSLEPDGTVSATLPVLTPDVPWKDQPGVVRALFEGILKIAQDQQAHGIHCLVPESCVVPENGVSESSSASVRPSSSSAWSAKSNEFGTARLMEYSGLLPVATVIRLERNASASVLPAVPDSDSLSVDMAEALHAGVNKRLGTDVTGDADISVCLAGDDFLSGREKTRFLHVLSEILKHSQDLPPEIRPDGEQLLSIWRHRKALVFCLGEVWNPMGIAAVSGIPADKPPSTKSESNAEVRLTDQQMLPDVSTIMDGREDLCITLEYVGVRPDCRRQGVGGRLLAAIENCAIARTQHLHRSSSQPLCLTVYSDACNAAALALYRKCGFQERERYQLLYRQLTQQTG